MKKRLTEHFVVVKAEAQIGFFSHLVLSKSVVYIRKKSMKMLRLSNLLKCCFLLSVILMKRMLETLKIFVF